MTNTQKYIEQNRTLWDTWTDVHEKSDFYDIDGFLDLLGLEPHGHDAYVGVSPAYPWGRV